MEESDFYLKFENKFRGSREQILDSLEIYNDILASVYANCPIKTVVDIGCGRGEWLEHCKNKGFKPVGVERNNQMFLKCQSQGFNVLLGDAFEVLKDIADNSVSIVTGFHFIEHINNEKLNTILCEIHRVLSPAGVLIFETPSIDNLSVSSKLFYLDPTHINPINPDEIIFRLTHFGFSQAKYFYMKPGPLVDSYPLAMTRILNGVSQDLLILACKSSFIKFPDYEEFYQTMTRNSSISTMQAAIDFDREVVSLKSKIIEQEIAIFKLRQHVNEIENNYFNLSRSNLLNLRKLPLRLIKKILYLLKTIIRLVVKFFSKIYSFISLRVPLYIFLRFSLYLKDSYFLTKIIKNILYRCGLKDNSMKFYSRVRDSIIFDRDMARINKILYQNFVRSSLSKGIYKQLIKNDLENED